MPKRDVTIDNETARIMRRARDMVKAAGGEVSPSVVARLIAEEVDALRLEIWEAIGCPRCEGAGWIDADDCTECKGTGARRGAA